MRIFSTTNGGQVCLPKIIPTDSEQQTERIRFFIYLSEQTEYSLGVPRSGLAFSASHTDSFSDSEEQCERQREIPHSPVSLVWPE